MSVVLRLVRGPTHFLNLDVTLNQFFIKTLLFNSIGLLKNEKRNDNGFRQKIFYARFLPVARVLSFERLIRGGQGLIKIINERTDNPL